jgi:hypothetical protein
MERRDRGNTSTRARLLRLAIPFGVRPALSVAEGWLCHRFYGLNSTTQLHL